MAMLFFLEKAFCLGLRLRLRLRLRLLVDLDLDLCAVCVSLTSYTQCYSFGESV